MSEPRPGRRPSANLCSKPGCDSLDAIGWYLDLADGRYHSACERHAEVIPAWQKGDRRHKVGLVR